MMRRILVLLALLVLVTPAIPAEGETPVRYEGRGALVRSAVAVIGDTGSLSSDAPFHVEHHELPANAAPLGASASAMRVRVDGEDLTTRTVLEVPYVRLEHEGRVVELEGVRIESLAACDGSGGGKMDVVRVLVDGVPALVGQSIPADTRIPLGVATLVLNDQFGGVFGMESQMMNRAARLYDADAALVVGAVEAEARVLACFQILEPCADFTGHFAAEGRIGDAFTGSDARTFEVDVSPNTAGPFQPGETTNYRWKSGVGAPFMLTYDADARILTFEIDGKVVRHRGEPSFAPLEDLQLRVRASTGTVTLDALALEGTPLDTTLRADATGIVRMLRIHAPLLEDGFVLTGIATMDVTGADPTLTKNSHLAFQVYGGYCA